MRKLNQEIFIIHSSEDASLVTLFVDEILVQGLGLNRKKNIFCSSTPNDNISLGENWFKQIKPSLDVAHVIIQIVTKNFKKSEMCLFESGVAWAQKKSKVILVLVPPYSENDILIPYKNEEVAFIDRSESLIKIKQKIHQCVPEFKTGFIEAQWNKSKNKFLVDWEKHIKFTIPDEENASIEEAGFRFTSMEDIQNRLTESLPEAESYRVVGFGRQYFAQRSNDSSLKAYYQAIEKRLSDNSGKKFSYQRLTVLSLVEPFVDHLKTCFVNLKKSNSHNSFQLGFIENLEMKFTYGILDDKFVFINIYVESQNSQSIDSPQALISTNKDIIRLFNQHFSRKWRRESKYGAIIESLDKFENFVPYNPQLIKSVDEIIYCLKKLPHTSIRNNLAIKEVKQLSDRLNGLSNYSLSIENKIDNGKLLNVITGFVDLLDKDCHYLTISFYEFWQHIFNENYTAFIDSNRNALSKHAAIKRIYLIDLNRVNDPEYIKNNKIILNAHLELLKNREHKKNYQFKLLFINEQEYEMYLNGYKNFAIWENDRESLLFQPEWKKGNANNLIPSKTELIFVENDPDGLVGNPNHKEDVEVVMKRNKETLKSVKSNFEAIEKKLVTYKNLKPTSPDIIFLNKCEISQQYHKLFFN